MDLYIMRHGKAGVADHSDPRDSERCLSKPGREEISLAGAWMKAREIEFSTIASSPLRRAAETASIIARALGDPDRVTFWDELAIGPPPGTVVQKIREIMPENRILLVGHEPQLSSLVSLLICSRHECNIVLKKGGIARVRFHGDPGSGELLWLLSPGMIQEWHSKDR
ncbi:MAG: phosphohistidine phosphatase [Methanoregulaceae archaeon PtaB.Bin009]|jgi:phosphohistidine phosphatase|nr:MAG: phosphohistidine phosphatase [Methanoregulaceae archaeon PtaB.Bin009]HNQ29335.1 phosphohistidine phosphatase SixA [Methanolinea sp.]